MTIGNIRKFEKNMKSEDALVLEKMLNIDDVFFENEGTEIVVSVLNAKTDVIAQMNIVLDEYMDDKTFKVIYSLGNLFDGCYLVDRLDVITKVNEIK